MAFYRIQSHVRQLILGGQRHGGKTKAHLLKGQSNEIFDLQFFFLNSNQPGPRTNGVKIFSSLVKNLLSYSIFTLGSPKRLILALFTKLKNVVI